MAGPKLPKDIEKMIRDQGLKERDSAFPPTWKPEKEGETLQGKIMQVKGETGPNRQGLAIIRDTRGNHHSLWLSVDLQGKITAEDVGKSVVVYYGGQEKNSRSGRMMKSFKVYLP